MNIQLRDYQQKGNDDILHAFRQGYRAPLYVGATGSGKTVQFCDIAERVQSKGKRVDILVHRKEILNQTSLHLKRLGLDHGVIAPGYPMTGDKIQAASVYTIAKRLKKISPPNIIIVDECHHSAAATWFNTINYFPDAFICGFTATPYRLDGKGLGVSAGGFYDILIEGPKTHELMEMGRLSPAITYAPPTPINRDLIKNKGSDFGISESETAVNKRVITGCAISHYNRICPGVPAIAFCTTIRHAENVAEQFNAAGISALSIDGTLTDQQRRYRIDCLANGKIKVLTSCEIISEGTDIPVVTAGILLRPTQSLSLYLQQCGRVLRPAPQINKKYAYILDHVGNCFEHGFVHDVREWSLNGDIKKKRGSSENINPLRRCKQCYAMFPTYIKVCPQCGCNYLTLDKRIDQVSGELVEVSQSDIDMMKKARKIEQGQAQSLDDLIALATRRGMDYPEAWAKKIYHFRKGKKMQYA